MVWTKRKANRYPNRYGLAGSPPVNDVFGDVFGDGETEKGGGGGMRGTRYSCALDAAIEKAVATKAIAVPLDGCSQVVVTNNAAGQHGFQSRREFATALFAAARGRADKSYQTGALNANVFNMTPGTAAAGVVVFGWLCRYTGSDNNFSKRPLQLNIGPVNNAAGTLSIPTPVLSLLVYPRTSACDFIVFNPANAAGLMTITNGSSGDVVAASATTTDNGIGALSLSDANSFISFESLNQRELVMHGIMDELRAGDSIVRDSYALGR